MEETFYTPPERSRRELLWWDVKTAVTLWLIRHRLRKCPVCRGARVVHYFGGGRFAQLRLCETCTGDNSYLAETIIPAVRIVGDQPVAGAAPDL